MKTLLHVTASPRGAQSISRALGAMFIDRWRETQGGEVIERDLTAPPIPYMATDWIAGVYAPPSVPRTPEMAKALLMSADLIEEVKRADHILISAPMYNFTIPATLKSWIDYIIRPGFTFALAPGWPGLLADRPVRVLVATRDVHDQGSEDDQVTPVLKRAFAFMGVRDVTSLLAGGSLAVNRGEVWVENHLSRFATAVRKLVPAHLEDGAR